MSALFSVAAARRHRILAGLLLAGALPFLAALPITPAQAQPTDGQGNIGSTSYLTLPFLQQVYRLCWGCSPYLEPGELFFQSNPASIFNNASSMGAAQEGAASLTRQGIVPAGSQQRWEDTYAASFPAGTFPAAPAAVASDGAAGEFPNDPAFVAWRNFITGNPQYWDVAYDGGTMPADTNSFRAWGGQWGHISPLTPLDAADCPSGMAACTWGDFYAYRWSLTAAKSGGYGVELSDFADSQPLKPSTVHDFNSRIVAGFAQSTGLPVPSGSTAVQASWIVANAIAPWNDYLSQGYGAFYKALASRVASATGKQSLIVDQCSQSPSFRRWVGTDQRLLVKYLSPANYLCIWDSQTIQTGRYGPVVRPPMGELAGAVLAAAREPLMRNGAYLEADDAAYWSAIASFYPTLDAADRTEIGYKLLKRLWLWECWAHIADRSGHVRRALAFVGRDYWDAGSLTALAPLASLIQTVVPTQPFGPAIYYSTAIERAREQWEATAGGVGANVGFYLGGTVLQPFLDQGGGGYYVSDAALGKIVKGQANAPSAWIVLDNRGMMPTSERNRLAAIAPVVATAAELAALPNQPLLLHGGLTGFGFYDQHGRLIVVVSNPSTLPTAASIAGSIQLTHLAGSGYTATDLFAGTTTSIAVAGGRATLPVTVTRWDTRVFALTTP